MYSESSYEYIAYVDSEQLLMCGRLQGTLAVQVTAIGISMSCAQTSVIFTVNAGCPASHQLFFLYPIMLPRRLWLSNDTNAAPTVIYHLPVRHFMHYCFFVFSISDQ